MPFTFKDSRDDANTTEDFWRILKEILDDNWPTSGLLTLIRKRTFLELEVYRKLCQGQGKRTNKR